MSRRGTPPEQWNIHRLRVLTGAAAETSGAKRLIMTPYSPEEVGAALALALAVGPTEACARLNLPIQTMMRWRKRQRELNEEAVAAFLAAGGTVSELMRAGEIPNWSQVRGKESDMAGFTAVAVREAAVEAVFEENPQMIRACASLYAVLVDRAQILSGAASIVGMTAEERESRLDEIEEKIRARADALKKYQGEEAG